MKKLFTLAAAVLASVCLWAAPTVNEGTYSTQTISEDWKTSTWTFITPSSQVTAAATKDVDIIYAPSSNGKMKFSSSNGFSWLGASSGYIYVPAGAAGTISMTVKSSSDSRWLQLYVSGSAAADSKRLWSKYAETASDGKKGPQSFAFTASDLTTIGDSTFLHFIDNDTEMKIATISIVLTSGSYANCTDPELTVSPTEGTGFVGDPINIAVTSKNQSKPINPAVTVDGVPGVSGTDYTFSVSTGLVQATPLKAGTFVVTFSQASNGTYCAADESATFVISEKTPVASVTIDGPASGFIGGELVYTATATGATAYEWYLDDVKQGSDSAKFIYTAVKGEHSIVCKARNNFNEAEEWIASDAKAVTITKLCGELIKAEYNASTKTSTVTGVVGGTADRNTQDNGKLGSNGHYYGVALTSGSFMAGDTVKVVASALNGGNTATIYADKTGTTLLGSAAFDTESLTAEVVLTQGANVVYLYRKDSGCNPNIGSLSVIRPCEDSNDANIKSLTINGVEVEENEGVFAYTVSAKENLAQVAVAYTIHPLATATPASGFNVDVPTVGDPANTQVITVTAEDGTQKAYTISVAKAASLNNDATLKALSVEGFTLAPAFDPAVVEYTITKAYEAELPATTKVTAETNDANATFNVAYNELVANEILVQVLAEDGETAKTYSITVYSAEAIKSLSRVLFSNGFDAFIDNTNRTVKAFYLNGTEAPTATTITAGANCTAGEIADGKIVVTGADESLAEYAVTLEAVAANTNVVEESAEAGAFDGTETWVKAGLYLGNTAGFNAGKYVLRRQLKGSDAADDQRVIAGWVRAYFFVGNASKLELANTANKKVKYAVDGGEYTESEAEQLVIELEAGNHMIEIVTNQSSGDCNLSAPKLVKHTATALDNAADEVKAVKRIENGQLFIEKNGVMYNAQGAVVR